MFSSFFTLRHECDKFNYITIKDSWTALEEEDSSSSGVAADMTNTDCSASTVSARLGEALDHALVLQRGPSAMVKTDSNKMMWYTNLET